MLLSTPRIFCRAAMHKSSVRKCLCSLRDHPLKLTESYVMRSTYNQSLLEGDTLALSVLQLPFADLTPC